jgi:hypothetical protein
VALWEEKEKEDFHTKKTKRQRFSKDLGLFVSLRVLCGFVGEEKKRKVFTRRKRRDEDSERI